MGVPVPGRTPLRARLWTRLDAWLEALLPGVCASCGSPIGPGHTWCAACARRLPAIPTGTCPRCQLHPAARSGACPRAPARDALDAAVAAVWLEAPVSDWIHAFKYPPRGLRGLAPGPVAAVRTLATRAAQRAPGPAPDLVVPVALHPRRLRARGFNPALELARAVGRALETRVDPVALVRLRDTPTQTGLDAAARRRNLRGALRARRPVPPCVWLVDDVLTTGATVREAARALREAGARRVVALGAARTPLPDLAPALSPGGRPPSAARPSRGSPR
jgi:predicted amidophosphoribosyltransferase